MPRKPTGTTVHFGNTSRVDIFCIVCLPALLTLIALFKQTSQYTRCEYKINKKTGSRLGNEFHYSIELEYCMAESVVSQCGECSFHKPRSVSDLLGTLSTS